MSRMEIATLRKELRKSVFQEDWAIATAALIAIGCASLALLIVGAQASPLNSGIENIGFYYTKFCFVLIFHYAYLIWKDRPDSPTRYLYQSPRIHAFLPRILTSLVVVTAVGMFMPAFTAVKSAIPLFNQYDWTRPSSPGMSRSTGKTRGVYFSLSSVIRWSPRSFPISTMHGSC